MEHQYHDREDGLAHCKVCNGGEGSLPSECPGRRMTDDEEADVYAGKRDFRQGQWVRKSTALRGYFRSVTQWQAEEFVVQVTAGRFRSRSEAEAFGNQPMRLVLADGILRLVDAAGQPIPAVSFSGAVKDYLLDDDVEVSKLKPASAGKLVVDHTDYEPVNISISEFPQHADLRSFGSLAYGVAEG